ncbi:MAG: efflux transporter outer membrane subunit [Steroidobacteraceae bacterium]
MLLRSLSLVCASALLAACAAGPNYRTPKPPATIAAEFIGKDLLAATDAAIDLTWWKQFNDPLLDELIDTAVKASYSVAAANARLKEARALRRGQFLDFLPTVTANASYGDVRQSGASITPGFPRDYELYDAGFDATWELDLYGRVRRLNQSARAARDAAEASRNDVALTVISEVARNYFELRGAQNRLAVARRNADYQSQALGLVRSRMDAGRGTQLDTSRAEAQVAVTLSTVPTREADVVRALHRIEVLTAVAPGTLSGKLERTEAKLPPLPPSIALGKPAELLRRRPDVRVAERQLEGASARIGVAVADLFPRITVNGSIGVSAPEFKQLDDHGNDRRSFGPALSWAFLDLGRVYQQIRAAGARNEAALADYQQTVLLALEETENALSDYGRERRRAEYLDQAAKASVNAADLATQRFEGGIADFLTALDAYRTSLDAEDQLAESQTKAATNLIALYKALGGGWEILNAVPKSP